MTTPSYLDKPLRGLRPSDQDVWGDEREVSADDIAEGWFVRVKPYDGAIPSEMQPGAQAEGMPQPCGVVVSKYMRHDEWWLSLVDAEAEVERRLVPRRHEVRLAQVVLADAYPIGAIVRHAAAKKLCRAIGQLSGAWDFRSSGASDEFLIACVLSLTEPERVAHAAMAVGE